MATATAKVEQAAGAVESARTALDVFNARAVESGDAVALRYKSGGTWKTVSWTEWDRQSREIAAGLIDLGVSVADRVVILSNSRHEWVICDVGILASGAVTVPIYPSNTPEQCEYIINDCEADIVIVEDPHQLEKLFHADVAGKLDRVKHVIYIDDTAKLEKPDHKGRKKIELDEVLSEIGDLPDGWLLSLEELQTSGVAWLADSKGGLAKIAKNINPEQSATIIYTSGTTGPPKGVVLTHSNLLFECNAMESLGIITSEDEQLLFLPLAHSFAKVLEWLAIATGSKIAFAESVPKLIANMGEIKPTFMGAVPRIFEKAYVKIQNNFEQKRKKAVSRLIIDWALKKGVERSKALQAGGSADGFGVRMADKLVFSKVREIFGGRLKFFISGGAPLSRDIAEFFHSAGILILEGYGLTETTAATHMNLPSSYEFGTVGPALPGVEVKIAKDGEILIRGGNVLKEYYNQPEATKEAIDSDGWFRTGDIGQIEKNGHLRITDRKKDIIVTAGGKNVAPQNLENSFKAKCPLVSQVMVYGDKRKYLSALITLNEESIIPWAKDKGLAFDDYADLTQKDEVRKAIQEALNKLNADLASYETIKKFHILDTDFDQATGELTPTLKVKRKFCTEKFGEILEGFYKEDSESAL